MRHRPPAWVRDPIILLAALAMVVAATISGSRGGREDIDERVYRSVLLQMQDGEGYYDAVARAVDEKEGRIPSQVRSIRPPTLALLLSPFPEGSWRWLATLPALGLCLAAGALAGPGLRSRQVAVALTGVWMLVSLPLLYLHHELWGAPLVAAGAVALRRDRDGPAAVLCLAATAVRELFGLSLVLGLVMARDRRPWAAALAALGAGGLLHAHFARQVLDPDGFDPPLQAFDPLLSYVTPGDGAFSMALGAVLLVAAALGLWHHRRRRDLQMLVVALAPVLVMGAYGGRSYWALTWCAVASAGAALAIAERDVPSAADD